MQVEDKAIKTLTGLGLTLLQAKVYLTLAKEGLSAVKGLENISGVARQDIYRVMAQLLDLGLVEKVVDSPTRFKAIPVRAAIEMLVTIRRKETSELEKNSLDLVQHFEKVECGNLDTEYSKFIIVNDLQARILKAKKQVQNATESIKIVTKWDFFVTYTFALLEDLLEALKRGVTMQVVTQKPEEFGKFLKELQPLFTNPSFEIRYVSSVPLSVVAVIDRKEANIILLPNTTPIASGALQTNNPSLIELAENYFEVVWTKNQQEQTLLERYQSFVELTGQLGWTTNSAGEVVDDVPFFRSFTGQTYEEVKGWGWINALHPDDVEQTRKAWKQAIETKKNYETEYRLRRFDGVYRNFIARGVPVFENGVVTEWIGTCIDITERKHLEEQTERSYKLSTLLLNAIPHPAMLVKQDLIVVAANKSALDMGVKIGKPCWCEFNKGKMPQDQNEKPCWFCLGNDALKENAAKHCDVEALGRLWDAWWIPVEGQMFLHFAIDAKGKSPELVTDNELAAGLTSKSLKKRNS